MRRRSGGVCLQSYEELLDEMQRRKRHLSASPELVAESDSDSESDSSGSEDSLQVPTARVLLVGPRAVGKTTLLRSYLGQTGEVGPTQG